MENPYTVIQIDESTWRIEDQGVRFFLLAGKERALLIDSGMQIHNARDIAETLTALPLLLLNTHADPDHVGSNAQFDRFYMHPAEEPQYRRQGGAGMLLPIDHGDRLDLGDRVLEIIGLPGHTPGSIAVLDVQRRVLISGDPIQRGVIFMFGAARNLPDYVRSLERLETYTDRFDEIWPSHGHFPVDVETIAYDRSCGQRILDGAAQGQPTEFHGRTICRYDFDQASFLCDA